jgi:aryl-alcohol dehydrogenase-like predicted oxidoreductase
MKLVIGTANFLKKYTYKDRIVSEKEIIKILNLAYSKKISHLDTAFNYDKFYKLSKKINFKKFKISTKINLSTNQVQKKDFPKKIFSLIKQKTKLFKISNFENLFIHNFDELNLSDLLLIKKTFIYLKKTKIIQKIGISIYDKKSINKIKYFDCVDIIQLPINLIDRKFIKKRMINFFKKNKIKIQARSIFLQGLLLDNVSNLKSNKFKRNLTLIKFDEWVKKNKTTSLKACVAFIKNLNYLDSFVIGVENCSQVREIIHLLKSKKKYNYPKNIYTSDKKITDPRTWVN